MGKSIEEIKEEIQINEQKNNVLRLELNERELCTIEPDIDREWFERNGKRGKCNERMWL
ncbi:hypothetical protein [Fictibacillus phosphorivorans]|uniref:hypothetical protein n=1 Tax=Fictibacillus phosphorivorans TaxID=1221500 RepID=UPI0035E95369